MCFRSGAIHLEDVQSFNEFGNVPLDFKTSFITPILKKFTLDKTDVNNSYRVISNLSVISKLVCSQLVCYLDANSLMLRNQSAYHRHYSTKSALTVVLSDIIQVLDSGGVVLLSLLDLSAAFDCVEPLIMIYF